MGYEIIKGVTPPKTNGFKRKYPFSDMAVGDHFVVPAENKKKVMHAAYNYADRKGDGTLKFKAYPLPEQPRKVGVWRVS